MTVAEVDAQLEVINQQLPERVVAALEQVTFYVARDHEDLAVLQDAVQEAGKGAVKIPEDFRALFLGDAIDEDEEVAEARGVIVFNAAKLLTVEDVNLTALHEIGHALGFNEYEIAELGLE